jgi:S1-C subfamily serine protease
MSSDGLGITPAPGDDATTAPKLLSGRGVKTRLAVTSGLILAVGAWLTPRAAQTPLSAPQELAAPLLEEQAQLREASRPFVGVQDVAARVREYGVAIHPAAAPAVATSNDFASQTGPPQAPTFGVVVADTFALTHIAALDGAALDGRSSVQLSTAGARVADARVVAYEPATGLVLLQIDPLGIPAVRLASGAPPPGTLAVAAAAVQGHDVAIPVFITAIDGGRYTMAATNGSLAAGMPIYNLDGELLAIAAPDRNEIRAFPAAAAVERLIARAAAGSPPLSIGIAFQQISELLTRAFGEEGVIITDVVEGGPADLAGLQRGDVLLAVGEADIGSAETATRALSSMPAATATPLRVSRNGRVRNVVVMPALAYEVAARARARADDGPPGIEARALFPAAAFDRAGIPATARVLSINGVAVSSIPQARRVVRAGRNPMAILLRDGDHLFFAALDPDR